MKKLDLRRSSKCEAMMYHMVVQHSARTHPSTFISQISSGLPQRHAARQNNGSSSVKATSSTKFPALRSRRSTTFPPVGERTAYPNHLPKSDVFGSPSHAISAA